MKEPPGSGAGRDNQEASDSDVRKSASSPDFLAQFGTDCNTAQWLRHGSSDWVHYAEARRQSGLNIAPDSLERERNHPPGPSAEGYARTEGVRNSAEFGA